MYAPPYTVTNNMLSYVSRISEKLGRLSVTAELDSKPHLRRNNRIRSIHSSLRIEANSLSLGQVRDVINGRPVLGDRQEIQEVKNAYEAYERISEIDPYSIDHLKALHGIMTKCVVEESGVFRSGEVGVFNGDKCVFMAPPAKLVNGLMTDLFSWMGRAREDVHPLILSAVFHYEFVFIHPFSDGNGRMARLWHTALLSAWKPVFEYIPMESQIERFQNEYYDAIAACHSQGRSDTFVEFMLIQTDNVLTELLMQLADDDNRLPLCVKKLLDAMDYDTPYTASELMERLGLKSRNALRSNYLAPAMQLGLVAMTIPHKPSSRNQQYIRK